MITDLRIAEVLNTSDSYDENNPNSFKIVARSIVDSNVKTYDNVRPANISDLSIPLPGEHVLIFKGIQQDSSTSVRRYDWYYLTTYSLQSGLNNNLLPGVTYNSSTSEVLNNAWKQYISEKSVGMLQPYPGDRIIQGRWGNRIRLSSTIKNQTTSFSKTPAWSRGGGNDGDPIIVLSNTKNNETNGNFITENINTDYSSLYLTSTQNLSGYTVVKSFKQEFGYQSQFIGIADRINLKAKTDSVTINAPNNIELNTDKVVFGTSSNKEPGIHSTELVSILNNIVNVLSLGFKTADNTVITTAVDQASLQSIVVNINKLLNPKIQQDKQTL